MNSWNRNNDDQRNNQNYNQLIPSVMDKSANNNRNNKNDLWCKSDDYDSWPSMNGSYDDKDGNNKAIDEDDKTKWRDRKNGGNSDE